MKIAEKKTWSGSTPEKCDICGTWFEKVFFDAKTRGGQWGLLCSTCCQEHGIGIGTGLGQKYSLETLEKLDS